MITLILVNFEGAKHVLGAIDNFNCLGQCLKSASQVSHLQPLAF